MKIKLFTFFATILLLLGVSQFSYAQTVEFGFGSTAHIVGVTDNKIALQGTDTVLEKELIDVIKGAVNWVLGILGLIALLFLLYGGFQMLTAAGDGDKFGSGFNILKNAAIGLAIIGLARFIISIIFFVISIANEASVDTDAGTTQ